MFQLRLICFMLVVLPFSMTSSIVANEDVRSPDWTKNLIVYEIATKSFTSPNGPESGTFNSLRAKLPYLQDLGITGVWLTGHSLSDPHHFYNIWTQYAAVEPDRIDPSLGTPEDFSALISEAHQRGIRVFLDVITHGVVNSSPLIKAHPDWFKGGTWGMTDYDWSGNHKELDDWWVKVWTNYVTKFGVDGFRLDVDIFRPDLWRKIRENAAAAGHPIVIFEEGSSPIKGVTDFAQRDDNPLSIGTQGLDRNHILLNDLVGYYEGRFGRVPRFKVEIRYASGRVAEGSTGDEGVLKLRFCGLTSDKVGWRGRGDGSKPDGIPDAQLSVENVDSSPQIENVTVTDDMNHRWRLHPSERGGRYLAVEGTPPVLQVYFALRGNGWPSVQLSCHDNGWEGYPHERNPYAAQGSRWAFSYGFLFSPMIPIFMAGEEFDARFVPIPWLSPHLFGGKEPGKGRWLYGGMLQWDDLNEAEHRAMLGDVKKMISIRKQEADLLGPLPPGSHDINILRVAYEASRQVPIPYARWNTHHAVLVVANPHAYDDIQVKLQLPLAEMGMAGSGTYRLTDLWTGEIKQASEAELRAFTCIVKRDKTPGGGIRIFRIEPSGN